MHVGPRAARTARRLGPVGSYRFLPGRFQYTAITPVDVRVFLGGSLPFRQKSSNSPPERLQPIHLGSPRRCSFHSGSVLQAFDALELREREATMVVSVGLMAGAILTVSPTPSQAAKGEKGGGGGDRR